jgi:uncharacterized protein (TIGR02246 family)
MDEQPEKTARDLIQRLEDSWNSADGEAFGKAFTEDADFVAIRGDYHRSRETIAKGHHAIFNSIYKDSRVTYELLRARALADGVILAQTRSDLNAPSGPLAGEHSSVSTLVLVRDEGEWRIAGFHNTLVAPTQQGG